jgi:enoyl-CoA hydratase
MSENGEPVLTTEQRGHVLLMGLNRPAKRNAFNVELLEALGRAYERLEREDDLRVGVLYAHGDHFTGGLDLAEVAPRLVEGNLEYPDDARDPWRYDGKPWTKPVIVAVHGWVMTLAIELLLAADIRIASSDARFAQLEVQRGIYPFGGATIRLPREAGWGNAMRWLLTGEEFDAAEAHRLGLVQEVTEPGQQLDRALELADAIATRSAPLGVREILGSAQRAIADSEAAAAASLRDNMVALLRTEDGAEGMRSFIERRPAVFAGR